MNIVVTGGAGFIGSNLVGRLLAAKHYVLIVDDLSGGRKEFLARYGRNPNFRFVKLDIRDTRRLARVLAARGVDLVFHLAANADIARGVEDPTLDFQQTLVGTFSVLQAMRKSGIKKLFYSSGSGVYGDRGKSYCSEKHGPLLPVSMYGATKLGAEGLISAFVHLFEMQAWIVRPANIIGPHATHGVVYDFVKRLKNDPTHLRILGDGKQSKAYLYVDDVIDAFLLAQRKSKDRVNIFNLSSNSFVTVNQIASIVLSEMGIQRVKIEHTPGKIGWKGDVAIVRLHNRRLASLGWRPRYDSASAVRATVRALLRDPRFRKDLTL